MPSSFMLKPRVRDVEAFHFIYPSTVHWFAENLGGLVDVNGALWLNTKTGVKEVDYGAWIIRDPDGVWILTEAEAFSNFEPVDRNVAYRMLGGRMWPRSAEETTVDAP